MSALKIKPLQFLYIFFLLHVIHSFALVCRYCLPSITSNMARSFVHTAMQNCDLTDEEKILRYFNDWTCNEDKPQSSPAASLCMYVIHPALHHSSILTDFCFFRPSEELEPKWMNANAAFSLLKTSHPVTVHRAPPEKAARTHISRKYESHCLSLWCATQRKLRGRLVLGKSFIQIYKTHIPYLGFTSTLATLVYSKILVFFFFLISVTHIKYLEDINYIKYCAFWGSRLLDKFVCKLMSLFSGPRVYKINYRSSVY